MIDQKKFKELDSHWKEVMNLAQKYGFIGQAYGGTAILLTHKNQLEADGKETYIYRQRSMFGIDMEALKICYLTGIPNRMKNSRMILQNSMAGEIIEVTDRGFVTESAEYIFADCREPGSYLGLKADRAIIDWRDPMIGIAKSITAKSRLPKKERLMDDRIIGTSDTWEVSSKDGEKWD